jgi:metallo-beta-lactamase class B
MLKRLFAGFAVAACTTGLLQAPVGAQRGAPAQDPGLPTEKQMAESPEARKHIAAAMAIAKSDLQDEAKANCTATGPRRPALIRQMAGLPPEPQVEIPPTKIFDNLYYFGFNTVGGWALTTSAGIVLIDTLNSTDEAQKVIEPALQKLGLDPAQIKYIIVQHGHADHFGGASYLQEKYGAKVVMGAADWDIITAPGRGRGNRPVPRRDIDVTHNGQQLTVGDTTFTFALTPGHTPGSIALFFPITQRGQRHTASLLSLTTPTRADLVALERAVNDYAKPQKVAVRLASHLQGEHIEWLEAIRKNPNGPNSYLYSEERFGRYLDIMVECSRARVAALEYTAP